jgi:predicted RNase H-like HicB family nuclease
LGAPDVDDVKIGKAFADFVPRLLDCIVDLSQAINNPGLVAHCALRYFADVTLRVLIHSAEEGGYWAEVPALPGCVSQGETMDELRSNIREAIEGWLLAEDAAATSISADEVIEVAV